MLVSYLAFLPNVGNFSAIRTFRFLRPLKSLTFLSGIRVITRALLTALPMLGIVLLQWLFIFTVFGIVGVQLFEGKLQGQCSITVPEGNTTVRWIGDDGRRCGLQPGVGRACSAPYNCTRGIPSLPPSLSSSSSSSLFALNCVPSSLSLFA